MRKNVIVMEDFKVPRICAAIIFTIILHHLVRAKASPARKDKWRIKSLPILNVHDDLSENIKKANKLNHLTISGNKKGSGRKKECTLTEIKNIIQVLKSLKETKVYCIAFENLNMVYNSSMDDFWSLNGNGNEISNGNKTSDGGNGALTNSQTSLGTSGNFTEQNFNGIEKQKNEKNDLVPLSSLFFLRFSNVSPGVMLLLLRQLSFGDLLELEIETTSDDISGPLAALQCDGIKRLIIVSSLGIKKYEDLKDNSQNGAKIRWKIECLVLLGMNSIDIPPWILRRVTKSASLSLQQYFFLPEDAIVELTPEALYIKSANSMPKEELKSEIKKRKIKSIGRNNIQEVRILFNMFERKPENKNAEISFNTEHVNSIFYHFMILYSKLERLFIDFNVNPNDAETVTAARNWSSTILLPIIRPESIMVTLNDQIIGGRVMKKRLIK